MAGTIQTPCMYERIDISGKELIIEVNLLGVKAENIDFKLAEDSFAVRATNENIKYSGSSFTCCPVIPDKAEAKYLNGTLTVRVPLQKPFPKPVNIKID
ncbi:Hsp20/alpha crystallin family protein [Methanohalobium sp.]|uniref:Hsp20/alpha crystallin family protein n=1 Tax=Methanohalobium sp. TaxID=2837493 RepID=UPI0025D982DE|nr:Hsp20/alpha crystallin family protein [Methanohalobium sp.]